MTPGALYKVKMGPSKTTIKFMQILAAVDRGGEEVGPRSSTISPEEVLLFVEPFILGYDDAVLDIGDFVKYGSKTMAGEKAIRAYQCAIYPRSDERSDEIKSKRTEAISKFKQQGWLPGYKFLTPCGKLIWVSEYDFKEYFELVGIK